MKVIKNNKGLTLLELLVTIAVSSIAMMILMQVLAMSVGVQTKAYIDHTVKTESFLLVEEIKWRAFEHETQRVTFTETTDVFTITFHHDRNVIIIDGVITYEDVVDPLVLTFTKSTGKMAIDNIDLHSPGVILHPETSISVIPVDSFCTDLAVEGCDDVVIQIELHISIVLENGTSTKEIFETTIII